MKKLLVTATVAAALASTLFAGTADKLLSEGKGNSNTGCGLGSVLIKKQDSVLMQMIATTLNGTSGNQTFGITTGTSGCKKKKLVLDDRTQDFIAGNMDQLTREIAQGHGESINTLAELLNVSDADVFASSLQANYNEIYKDANTQMSDVAQYLTNSAS